MLLHENTNTANFSAKIRGQIYAVEKIVRLGQRFGVHVYTNCLYESDFLQWVVSYDQEKGELYIIVRCLDSISVQNERNHFVRCLDSISVQNETHNITDLTLSQLAAKLAELELIF